MIVLLAVPSCNRSAVMDQKDPNTISGLLKLHLRENGLLSGESIAGLMPHIESRDTVSSLQWGGTL